MQVVRLPVLVQPLLQEQVLVQELVQPQVLEQTLLLLHLGSTA
jgi:hypothetical protein